MKSAFLKLNSNDFVRGIIVAVLGAVLAVFQQMLTEHGVDFASYDWGMIFNVAITAGLAYVSKNWLSDEEGKVLGKMG